MATFERLVDKKAVSSPQEARLVELVAASERTMLSDTEKEQVLGRVLARREHRHARALPLLRPALAFGILLVAGATTAATLGRTWIAEKLHLAQPAPAAALLPAPIPRATARRIAAPGPSQPPPVSVSADLEAPQAPLPAAAAKPGRHPGKTEDPSRVVAAIQTLRNDHDPDRAARLLAEYLRIYPRGALAEEALALSIEAAAARHDPAGAAGFADRYLKEYPNGRFQRAAEQARR